MAVGLAARQALLRARLRLHEKGVGGAIDLLMLLIVVAQSHWYLRLEDGASSFASAACTTCACVGISIDGALSMLCIALHCIRFGCIPPALVLLPMIWMCLSLLQMM